MDPTLRQFRFVVAIALALQLVLFLGNYLDAFPIPSNSMDAFAWNLFGSLLKEQYVFAVWWVWFALHLGSLAGLLLLLRPARYLASLALGSSVLLPCWMGIQVSSPTEGFVSQAYNVFYLLSIGMAFFGRTVSSRFGPAAVVSTANGT
jgi:hypothetical protein